MALQNVRALLWRGEDLGAGSGNTREVVSRSQVGASARPSNLTQSFVGAFNLGALLKASVTLTVSGKNRVIVNRSKNYWITINASLGTAAGPLSVSIPVPPMQSVFLPQNLHGAGATISMNSAWPLPVPLSGSTVGMAPQATLLIALTFDFHQEG